MWIDNDQIVPGNGKPLIFYKKFAASSGNIKSSVKAWVWGMLGQSSSYLEDEAFTRTASVESGLSLEKEKERVLIDSPYVS